VARPWSKREALAAVRTSWALGAALLLVALLGYPRDTSTITLASGLAGVAMILLLIWWGAQMVLALALSQRGHPRMAAVNGALLYASLGIVLLFRFVI
jgi:hypothetical protein